MPYADKAQEKKNKHDRYLERKQDPEFVAKQKKYRDEHAERNREYQKVYRVENAQALAELRARCKHLWRSSQKDYQHEYQRLRVLHFRQEVLRIYGGKCTCCGEAHTEFIQVDHVNNDGAAHRKIAGVGHVFYRWLVKNGCPRDGFRLLCANCNWARGKYGYCPHERERSLPVGEGDEIGGDSKSPPI